MEVSCKFWPRGGDSATGPDGFWLPVGYQNFSRAVLLCGLWGDQGYGINFIFCEGFVVYHFQYGTQVIHHMVYKKELEVKQKVRLSLYQGRRSFNQGLYTLDDCASDDSYTAANTTTTPTVTATANNAVDTANYMSPM